LGHAAGAGGEVEVEAVPRTDDGVGLEPALGERTVLVRAQRTHPVEAAAARIEDGDGDRSAVDEVCLAHGDVGGARNADEWHQRVDLCSASLMASRKASIGWAPMSGLPFTKNVGVLATPSARPSARLACTAGRC